MLLSKIIGAAAASSSPELEFVGSVSSTQDTIGISGIGGSGRLCVLADNAHNVSTTIPTQVVPAGFTLIRSLSLTASGNSLRHTVSYKILDGTEATLTGQTALSTRNKMAVVFRFKVGSISSVDLRPSSSGNGQIINGNLTQQTLIVGNQFAPCINIGTYGATSNRSISGLSPRDGALPGTSSQLAVHYKIINSSAGAAGAAMSGAASSFQAMTSFTVNVS
jgi:hypothetical protein